MKKGAITMMTMTFSDDVDDGGADDFDDVYNEGCQVCCCCCCF